MGCEMSGLPECSAAAPHDGKEHLFMGFSNPELNRVRQGWDKERRASERTDPDYEEHVEEKFLHDLLTLTEAEQLLALESYPRKKRKELAERLAQMKEHKQ
jgi:YD repeat-containing protein